MGRHYLSSHFSPFIGFFLAAAAAAGVGGTSQCVVDYSGSGAQVSCLN